MYQYPLPPPFFLKLMLNTPLDYLPLISLRSRPSMMAPKFALLPSSFGSSDIRKVVGSGTEPMMLSLLILNLNR